MHLFLYVAQRPSGYSKGLASRRPRTEPSVPGMLQNERHFRQKPRNLRGSCCKKMLRDLNPPMSDGGESKLLRLNVRFWLCQHAEHPPASQHLHVWYHTR